MTNEGKLGSKVVIVAMPLKNTSEGSSASERAKDGHPIVSGLEGLIFKGSAR